MAQLWFREVGRRLEGPLERLSLALRFAILVPRLLVSRKARAELAEAREFVRKLKQPVDFGDLSDWLAVPITTPPIGFDRAVPPERRPHAIRLRGTVVRLHRKDRFSSGDQFFATFEDAPYKWEDRARFAGKDVNCGHYFSLTERGAKSEVTHYGSDPDRLGLLELEIDLGDVLDLTTIEGLYYAFNQNVENPEVLREDNRLDQFIFNELVEIGSGGSILTTRIGYWAVQQGYKAILFFGARFNRPHQERTVLLDHGFIVSAASSLRSMRDDPDRINLVVLGGSILTRAVRSYEMKGEVPRAANPFCQWSEDELDPLLSYGRAVQAARSRFEPLPRIVYAEDR